MAMYIGAQTLGNASMYPIQWNQGGVQGAIAGSNGISGYGFTTPTDGGSFYSGQFPGVAPTGGTASPSSGAASGASGIAGGVSIGLAIGQAVGSLYSAWQSGKTTKYVMQKQAEISEYNRQMAQRSSETAWRQGEAEIAKLTYRAGEIKAKQRTGFASSGVRLGTGTTSEVMASTDIMKEVDVKNTRLAALSAAWGYKQAAITANGQGQIYSGMSNYAKNVSIGNGLSSFLSGAGDVASKWYKFYGD